MAAEAREGIGDDVGWLLWPSPDDSEAIGHGFDGRSMSWWMFLLWVVREKVRYLVRTLTKKWRSAQLTFFNRSLSDLDVSFVIKNQYLIYRAWSELSKTVLTLI
jgi:hypothetical protein